MCKYLNEHIIITISQVLTVMRLCLSLSTYIHTLSHVRINTLICITYYYGDLLDFTHVCLKRVVRIFSKLTECVDISFANNISVYSPPFVLHCSPRIGIGDGVNARVCCRFCCCCCCCCLIKSGVCVSYFLITGRWRIIMKKEQFK